jgi:hypothetical protein
MPYDIPVVLAADGKSVTICVEWAQIKDTPPRANIETQSFVIDDVKFCLLVQPKSFNPHLGIYLKAMIDNVAWSANVSFSVHAMRDQEGAGTFFEKQDKIWLSNQILPDINFTREDWGYPHVISHQMLEGAVFTVRTEIAVHSVWICEDPIVCDSCDLDIVIPGHIADDVRLCSKCTETI